MSATATLEMGHHICLLGIGRYKIALGEALTATLKIERLLLLLLLIRLSAAVALGNPKYLCEGCGIVGSATVESLFLIKIKYLTLHKNYI